MMFLRRGTVSEDAGFKTLVAPGRPGLLYEVTEENSVRDSLEGRQAGIGLS